MKNQPESILPEIKTMASFSNEEAYSLLLNNLSDTFILIDRELKVITATEQSKIKIRQYFGAELIVGMPIVELAPPERRAFLTALYQDILNGGPERVTEAEIRVGNQVLMFRNHFKAAKNELGEIVGVVVNAREVTNEKVAAQHLKTAEERWRFALEGAQQGVWDWNMLTGECFYSEGYRKLYGYEDDDLDNNIEEWKSLIHPEDQEKMNQAIEEHQQSPSPFHESTYRLKAKDGSYKWIMARGMIIEKDLTGKPIRMIGTHTDISDQLISKEKIRVSEQNYRNLFQANPLACWIYDSETLCFLEVNQAAVDHYGYSRDEFLSSNLELVHPENFRDTLYQRLKEEKTISSLNFNNWRHRKKNGNEIYVDLSINSIQYNNHCAKLVVINDVTTRMLLQQAQEKTEEQLRKSNERFQLASKATSDAIYDWDITRNELFWGEGMQTLFGFAPREVTIEKWEDLVHPADRPRVVSSLSEALKNSTKWQCKYRFSDTSGNYRYVLDRGFITRDENGHATRMIGSLQDITDLKQKEDELLVSNERYKYATQATFDIVWDWDIKNEKVVWSDNFEKIMGWHLPENKTLSLDYCFTLLHPEDEERIRKKINETINDRNKTYWHQEFRYRRADGSFCYVSDRAYVIRNEMGQATRIIGAMQDITERNYYEQFLALERQIFTMSANLNVSLQEITDTLLKGIESINPDSYTTVLLLKEDMMELLSAPSLPAELRNALKQIKIGPEVGSSGTSMFRKETIITEDIYKDPNWENFIPLASKYGFRASWSFPVIHSSGMVMGAFSIYFKKVKSPTSAELDNMDRIRNILRVLMEHYWSLEEIKKVNERFDIMMKATHDLVWDWDLETNRIYRDEIGLKNVYGMSENSSIDNIFNWLLRIHPDDHSRVEKVIGEILQAKVQDTFDVEYRFLRDDGTYSHVYDRGMIIRNQEGKPVRMIGAAQDITVRKKLEQELLQNELERQKAINQATVDTQEQERSEIGKELHDNVNQVLTTTKLYLDLALSNNELKDDLIIKSSRNIISVINEIRQLSRSLMDPSIGDLGLIESIHDLIDNINLTRKFHVQLTADKKIETHLNNNHRLTIFRIIQEALNNAIKHARATKVHITITRKNKMVEMTICDDGRGFDPASVKKGVGLKNIQNRIYLINGSHNIISAPGNGCTISISFPLNKNQS